MEVTFFFDCKKNRLYDGFYKYCGGKWFAADWNLFTLFLYLLDIFDPLLKGVLLLLTFKDLTKKL